MIFPEISESEYSTIQSEDEDIIILMNVPAKIDKTVTTGQVGGQAPKPIIQTPSGFNPTNPVCYPKLKWTMPIFSEDSNKPWRENPATRDDYFNYGFSEEIWEAYKYKQMQLRHIFKRKKQNSGNQNSESKKNGRRKNKR